MEKDNLLIFKRLYDFYRVFYELRKLVNKQDRYNLWQKCDTSLLNLLEDMFIAGSLAKIEKLRLLQDMSSRLNFFKIMIRLLKDVKSIDDKKYIFLEEKLDEVGRMLGGWIKFLKN